MLMPAWVSGEYFGELSGGEVHGHARVAVAFLVFVAVDERLVEVEDDGLGVW